MVDRSTNEYLNTERAKNDENDLFAAIGKQVLGLNLGDDEKPTEDDRVKVVDEIESLCMNCHENVSLSLLSPDMQVKLVDLRGRASHDYYSQKSPTSARLS